MDVTRARSKLKSVIRRYSQLLTIAHLETAEDVDRLLEQFSFCVTECPHQDPEEEEREALHCCFGVPARLRGPCQSLAKKAHKLCRQLSALEDPSATPSRADVGAVGRRFLRRTTLAIVSVLVVATLWWRGVDVLEGVLADLHLRPRRQTALLERFRVRLARLRRQPDPPDLSSLAAWVRRLLSSENVSWAYQLSRIFSTVLGLSSMPMLAYIHTGLGALAIPGLLSFV